MSAYCRDFECEARTFDTLPGFVDGGRAVVVTHPLWPEHSNVEDNVLARARVAAGRAGEVRTVDTFNLAAHPARVRGWLTEEAHG